MPKITAHPGVSVVMPATGYVFEAIYNHPLLRKRVKRSLRTTDRAQAETYARELSAILINPNCWRKLPDGTSPAVEAVWHGDIIDQTVADAVISVVSNAAAIAPIEKTVITIEQEDGSVRKILSIDRKTFGADKALSAADKLQAENARLRDELVISQKKIDNLTALLKSIAEENGA
jgi:hypothetical protein